METVIITKADMTIVPQSMAPSRYVTLYIPARLRIKSFERTSRSKVVMGWSVSRRQP